MIVHVECFGATNKDDYFKHDALHFEHHSNDANPNPTQNAVPPHY